MSDLSASCGRQGQVDRHFAGTLGVTGEQQLRVHLVDCGPCRTRYGRHLRLAQLDPRALGFKERLRLGLGLRRRLAGLDASWVAVAGALALGALLLLPGWPRQRAAEPPGLHPRGSGLAALPLVLALDDRGTEVSAFRTSGPGAPAPATARIAAGDELAFAYRNGGGWTRLMVFARDEHGAVFWFYPQWVDPASDPLGVDLGVDPGLHELPAAVSHDFGGHQLLLCALASRQPLSARQVERALAEDRRRSPAEVLQGGDRAIACHAVEVAR
jgi:hypothetical protein